MSAYFFDPIQEIAELARNFVLTQKAARNSLDLDTASKYVWAGHILAEGIHRHASYLRLSPDGEDVARSLQGTGILEKLIRQNDVDVIAWLREVNEMPSTKSELDELPAYSTPE